MTLKETIALVLVVLLCSLYTYVTWTSWQWQGPLEEKYVTHVGP